MVRSTGHDFITRTGPVFRPERTAISASTLYRFLKQRGLSEKQLLAPLAHKKFEAELSNQIWQADMLFGPWVQRPKGGRMQVSLHATLDEASRLIPHAKFYASQGLDRHSIACARRRPVVRRAVCTSTMPKCIARRNWRALQPPWVLW
jgi:hypothetical protein